MRLNRTGVVAGLLYVVAGAAWLALGRPDNMWLVGAWLLIVAIVGCAIPGVANHVSLARAYLAAPAFVYALAGEYAFLAVAVALAGLTDLVDGTIARRFGSPSQLGGGLDPVVDGLFLGALTVGLALGGAFPVWLAIVVIARYLLPALAGAVLIAMGRTPELRHTLTGQVSTTLILVLVGGVCLLRGLDQASAGFVVAAEVVIPVATAATFVHLGWAALARPAAVEKAG